MEIIIAAVLLAIIWIGNIPARACKRKGTESWLEAQNNYNEWLKLRAQKLDCYYEDKAFILDCCFYADGSLREDPVTRQKYAKGERYSDSRGRGPYRDPTFVSKE